MADVKLFLLGAPYLAVDGQVVEIQRRKVLALFSYLAVTSQPHRRDTLATLLWPDSGQSQARAALGRHLSELRDLVGSDHVQADRETIGLIGNLWLDVHHSQQLITGLDPTAPAARERFSQAVSLYRGDFMTGFTLPDCPDFDEWQFFQSENLRQQFANALAHLITMHCADGDYGAALPHARRRLVLDTLDEAAHRQVMELYARSGQVSAALRQYELCIQILAEEFGALPAAETTALYERIRRGEVGRGERPSASVEQPSVQPALKALPTAPTPSKARHNLPPQPTPFIGREVELAAVARLLDEAAGRLVTIVGPGGMGKTRLALAVAKAQVADARFADGVFFVSLAPLSDGAHIVPAIAEAIGYLFETEGQTGHSARAQLLNYLRERKLLLVLDNFEHLLDGVELVPDILQAAPQVRILATSRERLHLRGEQLFPIQGLGFPDWETPGDAATYTAGQLFIQSARRIQPHFELAAGDLTHLTHICRLVEGMPLGIELAAGWVDLLSLAEIAAEIQRSLDFLATETRNVPDRQRSMRAVFDSSWERLSEQEQQTFARFAVFRGGFTRQAAQTTTGASLRLLSALVSKSLLQYDQASERYQIHELLRQYAAEKLAATGQTVTVRDAHAAYFAGFLHQQEAALKGPGQRQAKAEIAADFENVREAWLWAVERRDYPTLARAMEGLYWFLHHDLQRYHAGQALFQIGRERLAPAGNEAPHPVWGKLLARVLPYGSGEFEAPAQAKAWVEQALAIAEVHGDEVEQAFCQWMLARANMILGDLAAAAVELEQSLRYYRQVGDRFYVAWALKMLGSLCNRQRQPRQAVDYFQQSLHLHRELGIAEVHLLFDLGLALANGLGEFAQAEAHLGRAYQVSQRAENPNDMAGALVYLSRILAAKGDLEQAQRSALEALAIAEANNLAYRQLQARMDLGLRAYERAEFAQALAYLSQVQARSTTYGNQMRIEVVSGLARFHLGQPEGTWPYLASRLCEPVKLAYYNLPLAALLFQEAGKLEEAVRLLALFFTVHGKGLSGLLGRRIASEIESLKEALAAALPVQRFAAAWADGQQLNLAATLAELAERLAQSTK